MRNGSFFLVERVPAATSQGTVELPILYRDATAFLAFFSVERERVMPLLAGTGLRAAALPRGQAAVVVAFFDHRDTTIGPYREVGIAVPVLRNDESAPAVPLLELLRDAKQRRLGFYVVDLPVTTPIACAAGIELWGYPQFVTGMKVALVGRRFRGEVLDPETGAKVLLLAGRHGLGLPLPGFDLLLFSQRNGLRLRTVVDVRARMVTATAGDMVLAVGPSSHRMAHHLRELGLDGARPTLIQATERFQSRLHRGLES